MIINSFVPASLVKKNNYHRRSSLAGVEKKWLLFESKLKRVGGIYSTQLRDYEKLFPFIKYSLK
jgi:hypothetical protein